VQNVDTIYPGNLAHITYAALLVDVNISSTDISTSAKRIYLFQKRELLVAMNSDVCMCVSFFTN